MVMKMNDPTSTTVVVETAQQQHTNSNVVTITLHPQPNEGENCDNNSTTMITSAVTNVSSCEDEKARMEERQAIIKKNLKLDLTCNNNESIEEDAINSSNSNGEVIESPGDKDDLSFKSPTSPRGRNSVSRVQSNIFHFLILFHSSRQAPDVGDIPS
jgi:hypothetical protein